MLLHTVLGISFDLCSYVIVLENAIDSSETWSAGAHMDALQWVGKLISKMLAYKFSLSGIVYNSNENWWGVLMSMHSIFEHTYTLNFRLVKFQLFFLCIINSSTYLVFIYLFYYLFWYFGLLDLCTSSKRKKELSQDFFTSGWRIFA